MDLYAKIDTLEQLQPGWDSYDALPPTEGACQRGKQMVSWAAEFALPLPRVEAMADGGIFIGWRQGLASAAVECCNDGEDVALISDGAGEVECWIVADDQCSKEHAFLTIRRHLQRFSEAPAGEE